MECSWNDGSKAQYYVVILDRLLGRSGGLEQAPEWRVRGPLTVSITQLTLGSSESTINSSLPSCSRCHGMYYIALLGSVVISVLICVPIATSTQTVRATGHKTPGESLVNITVSSYDTTHLQENPQRLG